MKNLRHLFVLGFLSFIASNVFAQNKAVFQDQSPSPDTKIQQMAIAKTAVFNDVLALTPSQQTQVQLIIEKYDDINTLNGTTTYTITRAAEGEILEILTQTQLQVYKQNMDRIHNSLVPAQPQAAPVQKGEQQQTKSSK